MKKIYVFKLYIIKMFLKWVKNEIFIVFIIYKKKFDYYCEKIKN